MNSFCARGTKQSFSSTGLITLPSGHLPFPSSPAIKGFPLSRRHCGSVGVAGPADPLTRRAPQCLQPPPVSRTGQACFHREDFPLARLFHATCFTMTPLGVTQALPILRGVFPDARVEIWSSHRSLRIVCVSFTALTSLSFPWNS